MSLIPCCPRSVQDLTKDSDDDIDGISLSQPSSAPAIPASWSPSSGTSDGWAGNVDAFINGPGAHAIVENNELLQSQLEESIKERALECSSEVKKAESEGETREPLPGLAKGAELLKEALEQGDINLRSCLGQKFAAFIKSDPEQAKLYKDAKAPGQTQALKKAFRLKWAQTEYEKITVKKTKLEEWKVVKGDIGTYEPLERVVYYEGGHHSASAWKAALNYVAKCLELGGMWVTFNDFTKRPEVMYVKKTKMSSYTEAWGLYSEQKSEAQNPKLQVSKGDEKPENKKDNKEVEDKTPVEEAKGD